MFIPTLDRLPDIADKTITGDALLTQRKLARYIVEDRLAHYVFIAKDNQPTLAQDIRLAFEDRKVADFSEPSDNLISTRRDFLLMPIKHHTN